MHLFRKKMDRRVEPFTAHALISQGYSRGRQTLSWPAAVALLNRTEGHAELFETPNHVPIPLPAYLQPGPESCQKKAHAVAGERATAARLQHPILDDEEAGCEGDRHLAGETHAAAINARL
jgi:hypothetical protein